MLIKHVIIQELFCWMTCVDNIYKAYQCNGNVLPHRHLPKLLEEVKSDNKWLNRNMLDKAFMRYKSKQVLKDVAVTDCVRIQIRVESGGSLQSNSSNMSSMHN